ncbi:TolC family protein, partial [bacterium]|nr:TolC family protein [bacterium]
RSGYFIAKHEIKKQEFELRKIELQLVQETDNAIQNIKTNYKRVSATAVSQRLAEEALAAEIKKLENGTSTSHNVLEFQNELSVARFNAIRAIVDLKKSIIDLFKVEGTLLDKLSITVE